MRAGDGGDPGERAAGGGRADVREDVDAAVARDPAVDTRREMVLASPGLHAIWAYRVAHRLWLRPGTRLLGRLLSQLARAVTGVLGIEKLVARKAGIHYFVDIHVQADPSTSLHDAHVLSGRVKGAIRAAVPAVAGVLVHMEPFE